MEHIEARAVADTRKQTILDLLRAADVGIVDIKVEDAAGNGEPSARAPRRRRPRVLVRHQSTIEDAWLPMEEESHGTQTMVRMAPFLLTALQRGSLLIIDELEASLHPLLVLP